MRNTTARLRRQGLLFEVRALLATDNKRELSCMRHLSIVLSLIGLTLGLLWIGSHFQPTSTKSASDAPLRITPVMTVRGAYWCGRNFDDASQIGAAVAEGDLPGIQGLLMRGRSFTVGKGTRVNTAGPVSLGSPADRTGIISVKIASGPWRGELCYMSANALE